MSIKVHIKDSKEDTYIFDRKITVTNEKKKKGKTMETNRIKTVVRKGKQENTHILRDCTLYWCKTKTPVDVFKTGHLKYIIKIGTHDPVKALNWAKLGLNVKTHSEYGYTVCLQKSHARKDGRILPPPRVMDMDNMPVEQLIGNGSIGDIKIHTFKHWKTGNTCAEFTVIKLKEHVVYDPYCIEDMD